MAKSGGFTPVRTLNGDNIFQTQRFQKWTGGNDRALIYVGDVVAVTANSGMVKRYVSTSANLVPPVGVVARVLINEAGRPRVHSLPDQHPNISLSAQTDWLDVYTDPGIVYECFTDASAGSSMIGTTMAVTTTARVTAAGRSGMILNATNIVSAVGPFKVVGISEFQLGSRLSDADGRVEAIINYGLFKSAVDKTGA